MGLDPLPVELEVEAGQFGAAPRGVAKNRPGAIGPPHIPLWIC